MHAGLVARTTRDRGLRQQEGAREKARETALAASSWLRDGFQEADVGSNLRGGAKMDAEAVVIEELKSGRNRDKLANTLSLVTSLQ